MTRELEEKIKKLEILLIALREKQTITEKLHVLKSHSLFSDVLERTDYSRWGADFNEDAQYAAYSLAAIGQAENVFQGAAVADRKKLMSLMNLLTEVDQFYESIGGLIGYQLTLLKLLLPVSPSSLEKELLHPEGLNGKDLPLHRVVRLGIEAAAKCIELYPVGGAADRLHLSDVESGAPLPAALLPFLGRSLLEGLIRDVQAKEYLAFKLLGEQFCTPIGMMTSPEKENHGHILEIFEEKKWFGRPKESYAFFMQPLVPMASQEGMWALSEPLSLVLKPGGHGMIWKLAEEAGFFKKAEEAGYLLCLVRQINNPIGGLDNGLLALVGVVIDQGKSLGFLSSKRFLHSSEGINVLACSEKKEGVSYCLTNIEYTDLSHWRGGEVAECEGSPYSAYPANTNLFTIQIQAIRKALKKLPFPGFVLNMKAQTSFVDPKNGCYTAAGGRLESMMQNIADAFEITLPKGLSKEEISASLPATLIYNSREKTISSTKHSYKQHESPLGTPEQAYFDLLSSMMSCLSQQGNVHLPVMSGIETYLKNGPPCHLIFHPALGPLFGVIAQKIKGGSLSVGSELQLEIAEIELDCLHLEGSLIIEAPVPLGRYNEEGHLRYGEESRCSLRSVTVRNKGIKPEAENVFWKNKIVREESLHIILHPGAEFEAEGIVLEGSHLFEVPAKHRLKIVLNSSGVLEQQLTPISSPSWKWHYTFREDHSIQLEKRDN